MQDTMTRPNGRDIARIKQANRDAGHHFFEPDTMRFFRSKVGKKVHAGRYFVTSEQYVPSDPAGRPDPRRYTIRECLPSGHISDVSPFQAFTSARDAHHVCERLARGLPVGRMGATPDPDDTAPRIHTVSALLTSPDRSHPWPFLEGESVSGERFGVGPAARGGYGVWWDPEGRVYRLVLMPGDVVLPDGRVWSKPVREGGA